MASSQRQTCFLCSLDVELDVFDADLFAGLLIVVEPVAFCEINAVKLGAALDSYSFPLSLVSSVDEQLVCSAERRSSHLA